MNPHAGRSGRLISSRLIFKSARWGSLCSAFNVSSIIPRYVLYSAYLSVFLPFGYPQLKIVLNHQQTLCAARVRSLHTPVHYTTILDVPILSAPTYLNLWTNELIKKQLHLIFVEVLDWVNSIASMTFVLGTPTQWQRINKLYLFLPTVLTSVLRSS